MITMNSNGFENIEVAKRRLAELEISETNKKIILSFIDVLAAENLSPGRKIKYIYTLGRIATELKIDFTKANKRDIEQVVANINNNPEFKEWTKHNYLVIIKRFYKWLRYEEKVKPLFDKIKKLQEQKDKTDSDKQREILNSEIKKLEEKIDIIPKKIYPYEVDWIRPRIKLHKKKDHKDLLTVEEVKQLAEATLNLRDRAFILLLYETGARIGEILNVKIKFVNNHIEGDVNFDKYGAKINLEGKTGPRTVRIISSAPALSNWLSQHPERHKDEAYLFCGIGNNKKGEQLDYASYRKILRETRDRTGIKKPINPHHFRHSRATDLAKKLTEAQLCKYMGWVTGSQEAATYVNLSGRDIDDKMLALYGLKKEEKTEELMKPIKCPRCNTDNDAASKYCMQCGLGLDEKSILEYDAQKEEATDLGMILKKAKSNEEIKKMLKPLLIELLKEQDAKTKQI